MASGIYYPQIRDLFDGSNLLDATNYWGSTAGDGWKCSLHTNALTPNYSTDTAWASTSEVSSANYTTGGGTDGKLSWAVATAISNSPAGTIMFDTDDLDWTTVTFTARYALIYCDAITAPTANPLFFGVDFGSDQTVNGGNFTIQWNAAGVATIDLTP